MQVSQKRRHLFVVEAPCKPRHQSPAHKDILPNRGVRCRNAAGQRLAVKDTVQIGRDFLEGEIIILMAMRAANLIEVLACCLLGGEGRRGVTACDTNTHACCQRQPQR